MTSSIHGAAQVLVLSLFSITTVVFAAESQCYGTVSKGRITDSVKLAASGANYSAYSVDKAVVGRNFVHTKVATTIANSYAALAKLTPDRHYVYGETGFVNGGRFYPHKTHQNGVSVDFFVPVKDANGKSVALPSNAANHFGYDIEFDAQGKYGEYKIDFPSLAEHLYQLNIAAEAKGIGIALVIFDPPYLPKLYATPRGAYLKQHLKFMKTKAWVRHDEHYHVDFAVACKPLR